MSRYLSVGSAISWKNRTDGSGMWNEIIKVLNVEELSTCKSSLLQCNRMCT